MVCSPYGDFRHDGDRESNRRQRPNEPDLVRDRELFSFHLEVWQRCSGQTLFATQSSPVASCQGRVRIGDVLAVLPGSAFPVVLRPQQNNFCFVGHAYVESIMQGEAWDSDLYRSQIIRII